MAQLRGVLITQVLDEGHPVLGFMVGWANALARRVACLEVICLSGSAQRLERNVELTVLPTGRFARYRRVRSVLGRLKRRGALDFAFAHMCPSYAVAATWPSKLAPTFLWYAHSSVTPMLRLAGRRCDRVFSSSAFSYPIGGRKLVVVGQGIDTERFVPPAQGRRAGAFTVCSVGRITKAKQLELAADAVGQYRASHSDAPLLWRIVGPAHGANDETYRAALEEMIRRKGLADVARIEPAAPYPDVARVYQSSDLILNTTGRSAFDKTVLEAMACGCLVLATGQAFAAPLGRHAELMLKLDASAGELSRALEALAALSHEERARIGQELRASIIRDHSLDRMMDRIVEKISALRVRST